MIKNDEHLYNLTRPQFAKTVGKSIGAIKQAMRRGKYSNCYIYKDGQYYFRAEESIRVNHDPVPPKVYPKVNRGNHHKGNYQNIRGNNGEKFREYNKLKKLIALQRDIPEDVAEKYIKRVDLEMQKDHLDNQKRIINADRKMNSTKNYGGPVRLQPRSNYVTWSTNWTEINPKPKDEYEIALADMEPSGPKYY